MIVLGLIDSKPSAAAVVEDGRILSAVAEERICRMKLASGMPRAAISEALDAAGISVDELDAVAVAQHVSVFEPRPIPWNGWFNDEHLKTSRFDRLSGTLAPHLGRFPFAWRLHHALKRLRSQERLREIPMLLRREYGVSAPIRFHDHHYCHATSAYFTSNFKETLIVTLDGGGDGLSGSVYEGRDGRLRRLATVDSFNSLGNFYSYVTEFCGFRAEKDEGKITGLAAIGKPVYADVLRSLIRYEDPGQIRYTAPMYHHSAISKLAKVLPEDFDRADLAASVQLILEEIGVKFIRYWLRRTGHRRIAVAGGVFANVKFNQRVHELDEVDELFVHPAMDDSGLSVGSALATLSTMNGVDANTLNRRLDSVYLGRAYSQNAIDSAIERSGFTAYRPEDLYAEIARLLADGHVVARFNGRLEYGPRALGNRSILYQTTDPSVNDWLNDRLKRTEFMPFAPATLIEHAHRCYHGLSGGEDAARFMTITFDCTTEMCSKSPGVVHVDNTARPQLVDRQTSPDFFQILTEYHRITQIPSVINTSFNMHEEPIVCTPEDALRSFHQGHLDFLAIGDTVVAHPDNELQPSKESAASGIDVRL